MNELDKHKNALMDLSESKVNEAHRNLETIKQRQVAALIQREFSVVLQNEGVYIYGETLVTVTRVRMSSDLGIAYIYLSIYNALYKQEVIKEMWENLSRLRGGLAVRGHAV